MKTKNLIKYFMMAAIVSMIFTACKKKEVTPAIVDKDTSGASDNALAEGTFNDVSNISDQAQGGNLSSYLSANNNGSEERGTAAQCWSIDTTHSGSTHIIHVNFTAGCVCGDGRLRSGLITISYLGNYKDSASTHTITFTNYTVNGNKVNGTHTVTNLGRNGNGHPCYKIDVDGNIVKFNGGGTIQWVSHRIHEWTVGYNIYPHQWVNDVFSISGNASGSSSNGDSFTETCSALKVHMNCKWIESGTLNINPAGKPIRYIDFGPEACDANATVTINGVAYDFTMQ